jgi:hypothetical protein
MAKLYLKEIMQQHKDCQLHYSLQAVKDQEKIKGWSKQQGIEPLKHQPHQCKKPAQKD